MITNVPLKDNENDLRIERVKNNFDKLINDIPQGVKEDLLTKKMYIGLRNFDGTIWEFWINQEDGAIMHALTDSEVIESYDLKGIFTIVETYEALYIIASERNQAKCISFVGSIKAIPKVDEQIIGCVYSIEAVDEPPQIIEGPLGTVKSIVHVLDNVYIIYNGKYFIAVSNGYNLEKNLNVSIPTEEPSYDDNASYW